MMILPVLEKGPFWGRFGEKFIAKKREKRLNK